MMEPVNCFGYNTAVLICTRHVHIPGDSGFEFPNANVPIGIRKNQKVPLPRHARDCANIALCLETVCIQHTQ